MGHQVPLRTAARAWFDVSLRTFGGPAGQISVMHREFVDQRRWIGEQRFMHALSYCTVLPGPEAQQLAIYLGWLLNGPIGGIIAGVLFVLPGYVSLMVLSAIYTQWGTTRPVLAMFAGLAPAVLAIVAQSVHRIATRVLKHWVLKTIALCSFVALFAFNLPFPIVIAVAGCVGWIASVRRPKLLLTEPTSVSTGPSPLVADHDLTNEAPTIRRAVRILTIGILAWAVPVIAATLLFGRAHTIVVESLFFSGTALVTFGGAYAVLSYVAQRAVTVYQWLLPGEMINGLALAETTPGPLIMVLQFVAFLGAYRNPGSLNPWVSAVIGATLAVWVTFVPCFIFVFLGAPHVEGLRSNAKLSAALTGITSAVVGVIANLSVYFAINTLFESTYTYQNGPLRIAYPDWSEVKPGAVAIALLAFYLVFRRNLSVLRVLGVCATTGAALFWVTG